MKTLLKEKETPKDKMDKWFHLSFTIIDPEISGSFITLDPRVK